MSWEDIIKSLCDVTEDGEQCPRKVEWVNAYAQERVCNHHKKSIDENNKTMGFATKRWNRVE
tara:strand:- start:271 stop:456 length:186 start_codon:yes stop_codon:yes gene_type:complete